MVLWDNIIAYDQMQTDRKAIGFFLLPIFQCMCAESAQKKEETLMCGIVGFTGTQNAAPILLDGLKKLEYRGGDAYLCSYNAKYSPIHVAESDNLRVIGRVLL